MIQGWVRSEIKWIETEAKKDQPWDVLYTSATDQVAQVWHTVPSKEEAEALVRSRERKEIFGCFKLRQRSILDPSD